MLENISTKRKLFKYPAAVCSRRKQGLAEVGCADESEDAHVTVPVVRGKVQVTISDSELEKSRKRPPRHPHHVDSIQGGRNTGSNTFGARNSVLYSL